jgi:malate synthase
MLGTGYKNGKYAEGAKMFEKLTLDEEFVEFLTLPAYEEIIQNGI